MVHYVYGECHDGPSVCAACMEHGLDTVMRGNIGIYDTIYSSYIKKG